MPNPASQIPAGFVPSASRGAGSTSQKLAFSQIGHRLTGLELFQNCSRVLLAFLGDGLL